MLGGADGRGLPASPDTERAILGSLLLKNELWSSASEALRPQDFSLDAHRRIFTAMMELGKAKGSFDIVTLAHRLGGDLPKIAGIEYLADLTTGAIKRTDISQLCQIVREKACLRSIVSEAEALQNAALESWATLEACRPIAAALVALCDHTPANRLRACPLGEFLALDIPARDMVLAPVLPAQGLAIWQSPPRSTPSALRRPARGLDAELLGV